jgi:DNA transposition AAA+ family ATPase
MSSDKVNINYWEGFLPPDQPVIETSSLRQVVGYVKALTDPDAAYKNIGVVYADPGVGKTIAAAHIAKSAKVMAHTGLPGILLVTVIEGMESLMLSREIMARMGLRPKGRDRHAIANEIVSEIKRNGIYLILVDEADLLNIRTFELLRYIFDKANCPLLLVGLPGILKLIDRHEKFSSRAKIPLPFKSLELDEIINKVLPKLVFSHWYFDPANEQDRQMGERLWKAAKPSLRNLRVILQLANQDAKKRQIERITLEVIEDAINCTKISEPERKHNLEALASQAEFESLGPDEQISVRRKQAKERKKSKSQN